MANSAQHAFFMVLEGTYDTTPATPALQEFPITGTTLAGTRSSIVSERIRSDRQIADKRGGNRQVGGDISVEFAYGTFDDWLEAALCGTWTDDVLKPGTTRRSFTAVRHFTDIADGAALPWHRFTGLEFNTLALSITPSTIVKAVFGAFGRDWNNESAVFTGATFGDVDTNRAFDAFTGSVTIDDVAVATITEIKFTLSNGLDPRFVVFQNTTNRPKIGRTTITGSLTLYFEDSALLEAFKNSTTSALVFSLTDLDGNAYAFNLAKCFPDGAKADVSGEADITVPFTFSAIYDDDEASALTITRIPSA